MKTRVECVKTLNCLEPDWYMVNKNVHRTGIGEGKPYYRRDRSLVDNPNWYRGIFSGFVLDDNEKHEENPTQYKKDDDSRIFPAIFVSSPLQCQKYTSDAWYKDEHSY
ncbi:hypothetical protein OCU04_002352 [Sclerotinia nivalis]|uniref:Uncharacterized protein n=1 Tax=Sclerotinia nivalis TaxID=352851 RepID=A0A9X0ATZ3_9HELO|nr:hypothetical protein OCU04_002352 [Sclerotinia nivalis]